MSDPSVQRNEMAALVARVRAAREHWCELGGGRAVLWRSPTLEQRARMAEASGLERVWAAMALVCDWRGFTRRDALGDDGDDEAMPFDAELWRLLADEREDWIAAVLEHMAQVREQRERMLADDRKN